MKLNSCLVFGVIALGVLLVGCSGGDPPVQTGDAKGTENIQTGANSEGENVRKANGVRQTDAPPGAGRVGPGAEGAGGGDLLKDSNAGK